MLTHAELAPLIDALVEAARTSTDMSVTVPDAELRRDVLACLLRIERRAPDGLRLLLQGLRGQC
jgi:hypothetical protein